MRRLLTTGAILATGVTGAGAHAGTIGFVDFDGTETGLLSYVNPIVTYTGPNRGTDANELAAFGTTTWGIGDAAWSMTRADFGPSGLGMPFNISDDSVEGAQGSPPFVSDTLGFAGVAQNNNGFFGITDTVNGNNPGNTVTVDFVFDITGAPQLNVSMDFAAMGDFEATFTVDFLNVEYAIDLGPFNPLFTSSVDDTINQTYMMDNPANNPVILDDPMLMNGVLLDDNFQTFTGGIAGTGSTLTLRVTMQTDGGEGIGFDNIRVFVPAPGALALLGLAGLAGRRRRRR